MNITFIFPSLFDKSFTVYVLPVPAGPAGAAPFTMLRAKIICKYIFSLIGVITSLSYVEFISYEWLIERSAILASACSY